MRRDPMTDSHRLADYAATRYTVTCPTCRLNVQMTGATAADELLLSC